MTTNNPQPPNSPQSKDDFYVNYLPLPRSLTFFLMRFVSLLIAGVLLFGYFLPYVHDQYNKGAFARSTYVGYLAPGPVPHLIVPRPGNADSEAPDYSYYLVAATNKAGPPDALLQFVGKWVSLQGVTAVHRNHLTLLAVSGKAAKAAEETTAPEGFELNLDGQSLGEFTVEGEIVDSKCYTGVMKPGRTKTHRGCAIRCVSGGIPPVLISHNEQGDVIHFVLSDPENKSVNARVLKMVGDPVRITGEVVQFGDTFVLKANPKTYQVI